MATLAITADLDTIADDETLVTYDGALGNIKVQLPTVVSGGAGAAVDLAHAIEFQNNGDAELEIHENGATGFRLVARMAGYEKLVLRSTAAVGIPPWLPSDHLKEIIATAEDTHIVDLAVTDTTSPGVTLAASNGDTYAAATVEGTFDTQMDVAADGFETDAAAAFAEVEAVIALILDAMEDANISASA